MFIVYRIQGPSGKSYIGMTSASLKERIGQHFYLAKKGLGYTLHKALRKYGKDSFVVETLAETQSESCAMKLEETYIKQFDSIANGYNCIGGYNIAGKSAGKYISEKRKIYCASEDNRNKHSFERGGRLFRVIEKKTDIVIGEFISQKLCAEKLGLNDKAINNVLKHPDRFKSHGGFRFVFVDVNNG